MAKYDLREATTLLARAHDARDPSAHYAQREAAGVELLAAVASAAKAAGYDVDEGPRTVIVVHRRRGAAFVVLEDDAVLVGRQGGTESAQPAPLRFDPSTQMFEGEGDDTFLEPVAGAPRRRRSAVAVVAEMLSAIIDRQKAP